MATTHIHRNQFLRNLEKCGLFDPAELREIVRTLPATDRGRVLARFLVQDGTLTKFQAENLLANRTNGFVLGQYKILDELGKGGMGRVFRAEHLTMSRIVALKVLAASLTRTEKARQLFQREVRAAGKLVHPHIVTAFDANRVGDRYFLVLEFIDGPTLSTLVREQGPLPIGQACEFVRQAALGLQHAHAHGMVHRDIKPSNLLVQPPIAGPLDAGGVVKITDFGLARLSAADEPTGDGSPDDDSILAGPQQVMGTPDYLSPEQGRSIDDADIRSDLYSLGCTFYFLLTGEVPFPGGSALEKLVRHGTVDPEPVEDLRPAVPPKVAGIVRALMAKDPTNRPQTPQELAEALEPFAEVRPMVWHRPNESLMSTTSTIDLLASPEGQATTGASVLSGTMPHPNPEIATALSAAELQALKAGTDRKWNWLRIALFALAVALGFAIGVFTIGGGLTGRD